MEVFTNYSGYVVLCISFISSSIYAADECVKKTPCSCEFANGTGIDLSPSAINSTFYVAQMYKETKGGEQYELVTYYYHPCFDALPKVNTTKAPANTCGVPLSVCRYTTTMSQVPNVTGTFKIDAGTYEFMGTSNVTTFAPDGRSIKYFNGPSSTLVLLACSDVDDELHVYSLAEPNDIVLSFYSRNACLKQIEEAGRSFGSTLCIIFFSFLIFYLVLGICTKKFLMGATGVEIVPNLMFWSDLPNLVKDGWAFTLNGFKIPARGTLPAATPDPNSYDSI